MTEEEQAALAAQEEAAEAARIAAEEAAKATPATPTPLTQEQLAEMIARATAQARAEWEADNPRPVVQAKPDNLMEKFAGHFDPEYGTVKDPAALISDILTEAEKRAEEKIEAKYGSRLRPIETETVINQLSEGLGAKGKEYIAKYAPQINPEDLSKDTREIIRRAARDYERENTVVRDVVPKTQGDPEPVKTEDRQMADFFAGITAKATGRDPIKLSDEQLRTPITTGNDL
jgi:hypothetical protein